MAQITYADKSYVNQNANIPAINKVQDTDMNEIKTVVNTNDTNVGDLTTLATDTKTSIVGAINELKNAEVYSTSEVKTNKVWIDGKPIYRKSYYGTAVKSGSKTIDTISTISNLISYTGTAESGYDWCWSIPNFSSGYEVGLRMTTSTKQLQLTFGSNYGTSNHFVLTIEYTKN